jgi:hypothetical protein
LSLLGLFAGAGFFFDSERGVYLGFGEVAVK